MMERMLSGKALLFTVLIIILESLALSAAEKFKNIYWYENGKPVEWKSEEGKFYFKLTQKYSNQLATAKTALPIANINKRFASADSITSSLEAALDSGWIQRVHAIYPNLEANHPFAEKPLFIDQQLLLQFQQGVDIESTVLKLEALYNIELLPQTEALNPQSTLIFRIKNQNTHPATVAANIYENEQVLIKEVQPNRMNIFHPMGEMNDVDLEKSWFLTGNGSNMSCGAMREEPAADAGISQAWANNATGKNIKVAVVDFFGYDYNHPDMQGQILDGWDCVNNQSYNESNFYFTDNSQAHGMAVAGVIAAKANNGIGSAGVAHDSKIVPFLIDGSEVAVVLALQKAVSQEFDADIINCSFGSYFPSPAIKNEIDNAIQFGRENKGALIVASHGNDYYDDIEYPQYPSAYEEVLSVGASTPDDKSKVPGDGWDVTGTWGTNYGDKLQLAAPGVCIFTTDLSSSNGYGSSDYITFHKTSAAAPVVSGIAALVLSQDNSLSYNELRAQLINTADKINSENYSYLDESEGTRSRETGYGRINALKAVGGTPTSVAQIIREEIAASISMNTLVKDILKIDLNSSESDEKLQAEIIDLNGRTLFSQDINAGDGSLEINANNWAEGMYLVQISNEEQLFKSQKIMKVGH